ncbi:MAG: tRNA uridine-5-carboxymethylaminomethyl(34) synthesis GTPase MnmE, partial [Clostridia bacterium]|nr:tRNA uridine-5-carboxymethylaminomethyl(34) synthesis GTPase MnmE [Clostridia bacterium]
MTSENIAAISTALAPSGVAVIRISGDNPLIVAEKMFTPLGKTPVKEFTPNVMYAGEVDAGDFCDFGMCVYFKAPKSFTGEDTIEFHIHGGTAITRGVLQKVLSSGARLATNGEFTKRAFINGKLSLSSAEGLIDMINSEAVSGVRAGYNLYREKLTKEIELEQDKITQALAEIDADMDFPEEDLEEMSTDRVQELLSSVVEKLDKLIASYKTGRILKSGVKVAIVGKPNTGKSSTLNAILNYDKAIVSDIAGTTRDIVEGATDINGVRFNFSDTAGIRESDDVIERMGVNLSKRVLEESDIILFIIDASQFDSLDEEIFELIKDKNYITVINKIDKSDIK